MFFDWLNFVRGSKIRKARVPARRPVRVRPRLEVLEDRLAPSTVAAPVVLHDPISVTVPAGQMATFTAEASGTPTPAVQWLFSADGGHEWIAILGARSDTLSFPARAALNGDEFEAIFSNGGGRANSTAATLTVDYAPRITTQPSSQVVLAGATVTMQAAAKANPTATVQWQESLDRGKTFSDISGATSDTLNTTAPSSAGIVEYRAVFSNTAGTTTSNTAVARVLVPPTVSTQPNDQTVNAGRAVTFTAAATGTPTPGVQWKVSTDGGETFKVIPGATSSTLSFIAQARMNGYLLRAVFASVAGQTHSRNALLTVDFAPRVTTQPTKQTVAPGGQLVLTAAAAGNPAAAVGWQVSTDQGVTFTDVSGATTAPWTSTAPSSPGILEYRAVFSNALGTAISQAAVVTVGIAPVVTTSPTSITVRAGAAVTFTAAATGTPAPAVQWQASTNGGQSYAAIAGATSPTLHLVARAAMNGALFRAVFRNPAGRTWTGAALLNVQFAPGITIQPSDLTVASSGVVTLSAAAISNPRATVQWQVSTNQGATFTDIPHATSDTLTTVAPSSAGVMEYRAVFSNVFGTAITQVAVVTVDVAPVVTANPVSLELNSGQLVVFAASASGSPAPSVQWELSSDGGQTWQYVTGGTTDSLTFTAAEGESGDLFRAVFTNPAGQVITQEAELVLLS